MQKSVLLVTAALASLSSQAPAQNTARVTAAASAGASVNSNPFLLEDSETALSGVITFSPRIFIEGDRGEVTISGLARVTQYSTDIGTDAGFRIGSNAEYRVDGRTAINGAVALQTARNALQNSLLANAGDLIAPGAELEPDVSFVDPTIAGTRTRTSSVNGSLGISHALSEVSSIGGQVASNYTFFDSGPGFDFKSVSASGNYAHRVSPRTWLTAGLGGTRVDYLGRSTGDTKILSPNIGGTQQLTETMVLTVNVGASFVSSENGLGSSTTQTFFSGSASLCERGLNRGFCAAVSRNASPTALGTVQATTSASLSFDQQLSRTETASISGRYSQSDQSNLEVITVSFPGNKVIGLTGRYSKTLNDRLAFNVTPVYGKIFGTTPDRSANYGLTASISYRLGQLSR
jgi:hypothetical protein